VDLRAALGEGELAHRALDGRLHLEHQPGGGAAPQVEEPPVQPALQAGMGVDRQRRLRQALDRDPFRDDLKATERHDRVGQDPAGDPDGGLGGQP
jgi:hypothetical protein